MKKLAIASILINLFAICAFTQTTEFTFQGNLKVGPSPTIASATTVNYDFEFRLCTSDTLNCTTGPVLVGTDTHLNVPVTDGIFTVKLNFTAANAFDGSPRWLEISIRAAGGGAYTLLTPRQQLTSTPYAIKSKSADNSQQLGGIAASQYLQTNGNGSGLTNLNAGNITTGTLAIANGGTGSATKNFVDLSTDQTNVGGNKTFTGDLRVTGNLGIGTAPVFKLDVAGRSRIRQNPGFTGNTLTAGFWLYQNNAAADRAFVGMTDDNYVGFTGNGVASSLLLMNTLTGNVGIGTTAPSAKLSIVSGPSEIGGGAISTTFRTTAGSLGTNPGDELSLASIGFLSANSSALGIRAFRTAAGGNWQTTAIGLGMDVDSTVQAGAALWLHANRNVGIGTSTPASALHLNGNSGSFAMAFTNTANTVGRRGYRLAFDNDRFTFQQADDNGNFSANHVAIEQATGNVGIGTTNPAAKLEVNGYTKLGSDAPAIRVKKMTGTTAATEGGGVIIDTGLDPSKILSISVMVSDNNAVWVPPSFSIFNGYHFNWRLQGTAIFVNNAAGGSVNILSKPIKILITYEQ